MATQSLVVSRDPEILGVLGPLMDELGMGIEVCPGFPGAMQSLRERKFDTVIVDCDQDKDGFELLMRLRADDLVSQQNQKMVAVGITSDPHAMQAVFDSGATFVLSKPLPVEDARRILKISKGVFTRAVRRFMRLPVESLSTVTVDDRQEAVLLNVSQRGLQIQFIEPLSCAQMIYVSFLLPDTFDLVEGMAQVMWIDNAGRAGLEFRTLDDQAQSDITKWVYERARKINPDLQPPKVTRPKTDHPTHLPASTQTEIGDIDSELDDEFDRYAIPATPSRSIGFTLFGLFIDALVVGVGTVLFFAFSLIVGNEVNNPASLMIALLAGLVFWTIYRFLFSFFRVATPGKKAEERLANSEVDFSSGSIGAD